MEKVILRIQATECRLPVEEVTIERILAEARAVGLTEFAVTRNGVDVADPDDFTVAPGDLIVILPADYEDAEIAIDVANDDDGETIDIRVKSPDDPE